MMYLRIRDVFIKALMLVCTMLAMPLSALSVEDLLAGYANNDIQLKELDIRLQQAILNAQKTALENGVNIVLSTGDMKFDFLSDGTEVIVSPELKLSLPSLNNTTITATSPVAIGTDTSLTAADVQISTDIISDKAKNRTLTIEKAERTIELAQRTLENHVIAVETGFWKALQALYSSVAEVLRAQDDFISEQTDFDIIQAQGYSVLSAIYRTAELAIRTAKWTVEEKERVFESNLADFAIDCGFTADALTTLPELPSFIDETAVLAINDFDPALYVALDESLWNETFNEKLRDADGNFVLSANAGYGHIASTNSSINPTATENNISAGLSADWDGLRFKAGVSVPLENPDNPSLVLGLSWDMNEGKLSRLSNEEKKYAASLDNLAVEKAQDSWTQQVQTSLTTALDLDWQRQTNAEELVLYEELYTDTQSWYEQGIVSSLDLLQTKTNYEQALYKNKSSALNILIYNLELRQLFIGDK